MSIEINTDTWGTCMKEVWWYLMPGAWTFVDVGTFWHQAISFWQCRTLGADKLERGQICVYSCFNWLSHIVSILRLIDFLMHSPLAASSRHLDPVLHQTEAEAKRQSCKRRLSVSVGWKLRPWTGAGWSGRSSRSKTCWRWRRHWRCCSLGEVEEGPVGVTGDPVAISGTGARHVSLESNGIPLHW